MSSENLAGIEDAIVRLRRKDPSALGDILRFYGPRLDCWLRGQLGRSLGSDSDDILVEVLCRIWAAAERAKTDPIAFESWTYRIARNLVIDFIRRKQTRKKRHPEISLDQTLLTRLLPAKEAQDEATHASEDSSEQLQRLRELLTKLSEKDRKILMAYAESNGEGPWAAELADELDMPTPTIRVRRWRLTERLVAEMRGGAEPEENHGQESRQS